MQFDFWQQAISLRFIITFSLVVGGFLPIAYSIWRTYQSETKKESPDK